MKFLVLRTDLKEKLKYIRLVIIDAGIFTSELNDGQGALTEKTEAEILNNLLKNNITVVLCSNSTNGNHSSPVNRSDIKYMHLDGLSYKAFIERLCDEYRINKTEVAFINRSDSDRHLLSNLNFSVATIDAPLEIKTNSYYVSNFTGSDTINEIAQIILSAKNS